MTRVVTDLDDLEQVELVAGYRDAVQLAGLPDDLWRWGEPAG